MAEHSFLQSKEWVGFQRSLGREVFEYEKEGISAKIIKHDLPFGKNYLYIPHGPHIDFNQMTGGFKNPVVNFVKWLRELGRKEKSIFVKAEPLADSVAQALAENKFRKSKKEIQPSKTVVIGLADDELEILGRMHHKTRYNIKVAENHGVGVADNDDIDSFWKLLKKTTKRDRFSSHNEGYYHKLFEFFHGDDGIKAKLFLAYIGDEQIAGAIVLIHGNSGYYLHGASDYEQRSLMAPFALHWHIIRYLKQAGLENYDMWGIDTRKWPGVTRFKLGWGGRTIEYPGSFDLPIYRLQYLAYRLARRIF